MSRLSIGQRIRQPCSRATLVEVEFITHPDVEGLLVSGDGRLEARRDICEYMTHALLFDTLTRETAE
jgi:hypothetical protein